MVVHNAKRLERKNEPTKKPSSFPFGGPGFAPCCIKAESLDPEGRAQDMGCNIFVVCLLGLPFSLL